MTALNRRWFRFSLRKLIVFSTMACLYFACWRPTKTIGVDDVERRHLRVDYVYNVFANAKPVLPLLLRVTIEGTQGSKLSRTQLPTKTVYCFWFFGIMADVPI